MKKISVEQLNTGMVIGKTVCTKDGTLLFTPGTVVESGHIKQMLDAGVVFVEIMECDGG
jgi:hypothetical protein